MKLIECPRDAIQGLQDFIPTEKKIHYLNYLLSLNLFDVIDFGSFVSPKAVPQMADTKEVIKQLKVKEDGTKLLAIIANEQGATDALMFDKISFLGFPFSISETFQQRNTNSSMQESLRAVDRINKLAVKNDKELVIYLSMAFGNPYGDEWDERIVEKWATIFYEMGVKTLSLADTVGVADEATIARVCSHTVKSFPATEIGVHLHTTPETAKSKIKAAEQAGVRRFDGAMLGYGGCPMAKDELVGNLPMEALLAHFDAVGPKIIEEMKMHFLELIDNYV